MQAISKQQLLCVLCGLAASASASAGNFGLIQQLSGGTARSFGDKIGAARHCSHSLAGILLNPVPNFLGKIHALFVVEMRVENACWESGNLRPDEATGVSPS